MIFPFGLVSWLLTGVVSGLLAERFLPGRALARRTLATRRVSAEWGWVIALLVGIWGAFAGGLIATGLGFGGLVSFDPRSLTTSGLTALVFLMLLRSFELRT